MATTEPDRPTRRTRLASGWLVVLLALTALVDWGATVLPGLPTIVTVFLFVAGCLCFISIGLLPFLE